jgi:outer membrane lipoprotein carrier protein
VLRVLLLVSCILVGSTEAASPAAANAASLGRLHAFVRDTQTMHADFTQNVFDASGRPNAQAAGEFWIARPGRFRWSVDKPYKQLLVGDGEKVWIYDPDLNQVISRKLDRALGSTPAALLSGREEVEAAFDWKDLPPSGGLEWLSATPKDKDAAFREVRLGFDASGLAALDVFDNFGQRTVIRISKLERNPKLGSDTFRFSPPAGADVINE